MTALRIVVSLLLLGLASVMQAAICPPHPPVGDCAPKEGVATDFTGDSGPMRMRKSVYALTPDEIAELRLAFKRLRELPDADPRSWLSQANLHCWHCAGGGAGKQPDIHKSWAWLPWHRDLLYTFEKILGQLVGNPRFALPYWDYNTPDAPGCPGEHLRLPPYYVTSEDDNSLYDCYRGVNGSSTMDIDQVGKKTVDDFIAKYDTFDLFFGVPDQTPAIGPKAPHGYVHTWVGSGNPTELKVQDLGDNATTARDPLFWAHHANMDRVWELWIAAHGEPAYPQDFLAQNWTFWNQDQVLTRMTAEDAASRKDRLHYDYAPPPCLAEQTALLLTNEPVTVMAEAKTTRRKYTIGGVTGTHVVLHLDELLVPGSEGAILRVYVNNASAKATARGEAPQRTGLVDTLYILPGSVIAAERHDHPMNQRIVLPASIAADVEAANGQLPVTIVPVTTAKGKLRSTEVRMRKPYFTVE